MDATQAFYSQPSYHYRGGGFPVFAGSRRQRGGSLLGSFAKMVMPVLGAVGKAALGQAAGLAQDLVEDAAQRRSLRQSLRQHGLRRLRNTLRAVPTSRPKRITRASTSSRAPTTTRSKLLGKRRRAPPSKRPASKKPRNF